jgi:hypothetical protein
LRRAGLVNTGRASTPMICSSVNRFFTSNLLVRWDWTPNRCATQNRGGVADKSTIQLPRGWRLQSQKPSLVKGDPVAGRSCLWRGEAEATLVRNPCGSAPQGIEIQL